MNETNDGTVNETVGDAGDALATHPFFAAMPAGSLARILPAVTEVVHPAGSRLARSGQPADRFHALLAGRAAIELPASDREPLVVATVHAGDVVGWSWFVEPHVWRFDVIALDDVRTLTVDAATLRSACEADHELGYRIAHRLVHVVAGRLEATRHQLMDVYGHSR